MESREAMNSGVTVIAPEAPSNYHMSARTENSPAPVMTSPVMTPPVGGGGGVLISSEKKKRGRPRKYAPDGGPVSRTLSPMPISASAPPASGNFLPEKVSVPRPVSEKKPRNKVGAENLGEWISCSTGGSFLPHMITVEPGEDVTMKIISFSQQGPRAICIISGVGLISNVTLRQPNSSGGTLTYEGRFEILSLSGSFTPTEFGGPRTSRTGGMSISLASPDGRVVGGTLAGLLIAASPVQVVVGSFLPSNYQEAKPKKPKPEPKPMITYPTVSTAAPMPHSSNMDPRNSNSHTVNIPNTAATQNVISSSSMQMNHWTTMQTVQDSRKSATDINVPLQGE